MKQLILEIIVIGAYTALLFYLFKTFIDLLTKKQ